MKKRNIYKNFDVRFFSVLGKLSRMYIEKRLDLEKKRQEKCWNIIFKDTDNISYHLDHTVKIKLYGDSDLSKLLYFTPFEEGELLFLKRYLKKGDIVFDVGANVGLFSLLAAPIVAGDGLVYAFEPTPQTYDRLNENIQINNFENIISNQVALSSENGELPFYVIDDGGDVYNSLAYVEQAKKSHTVVVNVTTLDHFISQNEIDTSKISFVKIDVEGWELNVLKGAIQLLSELTTSVLMVEFCDSTARAAGISSSEIFDFVKSMGFEWYRYNAKKNCMLLEEKKEIYGYDNLIATKDISSLNNRLK